MKISEAIARYESKSALSVDEQIEIIEKYILDLKGIKVNIPPRNGFTHIRDVNLIFECYVEAINYYIQRPWK